MWCENSRKTSWRPRLRIVMQQLGKCRWTRGNTQHLTPQRTHRAANQLAVLCSQPRPDLIPNRQSAQQQNMGHGSAISRIIGLTLAATAVPAEGLLPNATLDVLRALWEQTGGEQWTRCQWTPDLDPCAPPWGLPHWSDPVDDDTDESWGGTICFVCNTSATPSTLRAQTSCMGLFPNRLAIWRS
eukprot:m.337748 g.337748  ORF g.337748 m.337748 type:complete len:185 (+) comp16533_c3_seq35:1443-1997(+)